MRDMILLLLQGYSKLFYFVKHRLHAGNLRGFGFLSRQVKQDAILIGEAAPLLKAAWAGATTMSEAKSLRDAVEWAAREAAAGDVVLMSPACASFDMFRDYQDRGRQFKLAVQALPE